ncbi:MAG: hypothetical protein ABJB05_10705 [Parafilimonas sp.]
MLINTDTSPSAIKTIITAGLLVGSLDILAAFADYYIETGKGPEGVLRFIASGVFGKTAFTDNSIIMCIGLLFHFIIAFAFTTFFFILYPSVKLLHINILLSAAIIGVFIWIIMTLIIVPLSNTPKMHFQLSNAIKAVLILICMIGLPLSMIFKKGYRTFYKAKSHLV